MTKQAYLLPRAGVHSIEDETISALLSLDSGPAARLYLYLLRENGRLRDDAPSALNLTEAALSEALCLLQMAGLIEDSEPRSPLSLASPLSRASSFPATASLPFVPTPPALLKSAVAVVPSGDRASTPVVEASPALAPDARPDYTAGEVAHTMEHKPPFKQLVDETQRRLGRVLSSFDLHILLSLYDWRGMRPELISLLISHCLEETRRRHPDGRPPTLRQIEREAALWADKGLDTLEKAEVYIQEQEAQRETTAVFARALGLSHRMLSATEEKYLKAWADFGFDVSAIALAYDKTVVSTGKLNWKYMHSILSSWQTKGLLTAEAAQAEDKPVAHNAAGTPSNAPGRTATARSTTPQRPAGVPPIRRARGSVERLKQYLED